MDGNLNSTAVCPNATRFHAVVKEGCFSKSNASFNATGKSSTAGNWTLVVDVYLPECHVNATAVAFTNVLPAATYYDADNISTYSLSAWSNYTVQNVSACPSVLDVISQKASLSLLRNAIHSIPGFEEQLSASADNFTLFLPSNTAIQEFSAAAGLPITSVIGSKTQMASLLINSMLAYKAFAVPDLRHQALFTTAAGQTMQVLSVAQEAGAVLGGCTGRNITLTFIDPDTQSGPVRAVECPDPLLEGCQTAVYVVDNLMLPLKPRPANSTGQVAYDSNGNLISLISQPDRAEDAQQILDKLFPPGDGANRSCKSLYQAVAHTNNTAMFRQLMERSKTLAPFTQRAVEGTVLVPTDEAINTFLAQYGITFDQLLGNAFLVESLVFGHSLRTTLKALNVVDQQSNTTYGIYPEALVWSVLPGEEGVGGQLSRGCPKDMTLTMTSTGTTASVVQCQASPCTGYVYVIDGVLAPLKISNFLSQHPGLQGAPAMGESCGSVADVIYYRNDTTILNAVVQHYMPTEYRATLQDWLVRDTLLAVTNEGFFSWAAALNTTLDQLLAATNATGLLQAVMQYHTVPNVAFFVTNDTAPVSLFTQYPKQVVDIRVSPASATTYPGCGALQVSVQGFASNATVVECNIKKPCEAAVHLVSGVLLPKVEGLNSVLPSRPMFGLGARRN